MYLISITCMSTPILCICRCIMLHLKCHFLTLRRRKGMERELREETTWTPLKMMMQWRGKHGWLSLQGFQLVWTTKAQWDYGFMIYLHEFSKMRDVASCCLLFCQEHNICSQHHTCSWNICQFTFIYSTNSVNIFVLFVCNQITKFGDCVYQGSIVVCNLGKSSTLYTCTLVGTVLRMPT